jgi:predicted dehydrogenase
MDAVHVGVVGCGYWGPQLLRNLYELPYVEVPLVADLLSENRQRIQRQFPRVRTTDSHEDLLADPSIDAVVVSTPVRTHFTIARDALRCGKHVLVEKPLAASVAEAEELVALADERDLRLMVGHTFEYNPAVAELRKLMLSGALGKIHYIDAARLNLGRFQRDVNVIWDLAPHDLSILLHILGQEPLTVRALGQSFVNPPIHDVAYIELVFPDDVLAHVHVSWLEPCKVRRVTVVGSRQMVVYNDTSTDEKIKVYDKGVSLAEPTTTFGEFQLSYRYGDIASPRVHWHEPLHAECEHFVQCIRTHRTPRTDGQSGLRVVRVLEFTSASLASGGTAIDTRTGFPILGAHARGAAGNGHVTGVRLTASDLENTGS